MENRFVDAEELLSRVRDVDIILTEGYKHKNWRKIAVFRKESGKPLALDPKDCFVVMTDTPLEDVQNTLALTDAAGLAERIIEDMKNWRE